MFSLSKIMVAFFVAFSVMMVFCLYVAISANGINRHDYGAPQEVFGHIIEVVTKYRRFDVTKFYDGKNVCYIVRASGGGGGISCLKNTEKGGSHDLLHLR